MTLSTGHMPRKQFGGPKFEADPANSTYRWEIELTPGYPGNKILFMDGYSCGAGAENPNKVELFFKKLQNPLLGYLQRADRITIYRNEWLLPKGTHKMLLELYPRDFMAYEWVGESGPILDYLERFYQDYLRTKQLPSIEDRRKNARKRVYHDELDHSKYHFKNQQELQAFCDARVEKFSATCMQIWYQKHEFFQPELFDTDMTDALTHAMHTATTYEQAQAARNAAEEMAQKFTRHK